MTTTKTAKRPAKKAATKKAAAKRTSKRTTEKKVEPALVQLELACGQRKEEGWIGVDIVQTPVTDIVWDLTQTPWPFAEESSVDRIRISHFIEHIEDPWPFMNELHRVLKPGGQVEIYAPYYTSVRATMDASHKQYISEMWFYYYNQEWLRSQGLDHYPITADFDFGWGYNLNQSAKAHWEGRSDDAVRAAILHYNNVVDDIVVTMTAKK